MPESLKRMKFPKHRTNIFVVQRTFPTDAICGVFLSLDGADDFKGECEQSFRDRGFTDDDFNFEVVLSTYYET